MRFKYVFEGVSWKSRISMIFALLMVLTFVTLETILAFGLVKDDLIHPLGVIGYLAIVAFVPPFIIVIKEYYKNKAKTITRLKEKNGYLEHAAKIIRHDMHSGINTYLPRGIKSLERRLTPQQIKDLKIEAPMRMIKEGLKHTQKVYEGVYEFTNLVKTNAQMSLEEVNIKDIIKEYLSSTSYKSQVILEDSLSFNLKVNKALFCTAIDNLIRNGLKYNDSATKMVKIYKEGTSIVVEDNGRGMDGEEFKYLSLPYTRKEGQRESGTGLGLNICNSIMREHKFTLRVERIEVGPREFYKRLEEIEEEFKKRPDNFAYDRPSLEEVAKECNYQGKVRTKRGGRNRSKIIVFFEQAKIASKGTKIKINYKK